MQAQLVIVLDVGGKADGGPAVGGKVGNRAGKVVRSRAVHGRDLDGLHLAGALEAAKVLGCGSAHHQGDEQDRGDEDGKEICDPL